MPVFTLAAELLPVSSSLINLKLEPFNRSLDYSSSGHVLNEHCQAKSLGNRLFVPSPGLGLCSRDHTPMGMILHLTCWKESGREKRIIHPPPASAVKLSQGSWLSFLATNSMTVHFPSGKRGCSHHGRQGCIYKTSFSFISSPIKKNPSGAGSFISGS